MFSDLVIPPNLAKWALHLWNLFGAPLPSCWSRCHEAFCHYSCGFKPDEHHCHVARAKKRILWWPWFLEVCSTWVLGVHHWLPCNLRISLFIWSRGLGFNHTTPCAPLDTVLLFALSLSFSLNFQALLTCVAGWKAFLWFMFRGRHHWICMTH